MSNLEDAGFILRSEYRKKVFLLLSNPIMPSKVSKELGIRLTHITRELRFLRERGLVECLNPMDKTGRLYQLTLKGKKLKKNMYDKNLLIEE